MPTPEIGSQITPPAPEAVSSVPESPVSLDTLKVEKYGGSPEKPPQVEEKYKVEKIRPEEPKENIEEEMHKAKKELDEKFDGKKRDHYDKLGISSNASSEEIMEAYLKFSKETHPDIGGDAEEFKKVQEAFEILNNKEKRDKYDSEKEYQQKNVYKQGNERSNPLFEGINGSAEEDWREKSHILGLKKQAMELIKEKRRNSAVEERWSFLNDEEKQEHYNNDIEKFGTELENKRQRMENKLHIKSMSENIFYHMCKKGYKPEDYKRYGFFVKKIKVPSSDGKESFKMPAKEFNNWVHQTENSIEDSIKNSADEVVNKVYFKK